MMNKVSIENWFTHHSPTAAQTRKYDSIRASAWSLALLIYDNVPDCADRTAAIRKLRECVMTANAAIACGQS